jgi:type IV fimbrial biogenesis protein FimT
MDSTSTQYLLGLQESRDVLNRRPQKGFSVIELMIAVAIVAVVTALAFPSYKAWIQNTKIRTSAESILNGLQIARAEAVKRNASVKFCLGTVNPDCIPVVPLTNSNWVVGCDVVVAAPVAPAVTPLECPAVIQSRSTGEDASSAITVGTTPAATAKVVFNNLGTVAPAPTTFAVTVPASVLADARTLNVTLGVGGNGRMCDPALPATDRRAC